MFKQRARETSSELDSCVLKMLAFAIEIHMKYLEERKPK